VTRPPYSVERVANLLGLHVKTVRTYVRDGRLKAVSDLMRFAETFLDERS
jgi:excisionase family DNA binding protein